MTDADQVTEEDTEKTTATTASKTGKKARKKATKKVAETVVERAAEQAPETSSESSTSEQTVKDNEQRAKLVDKLKAMGVMAGAKSTAAAASATKGLDLNLPKWLTPQVIVVAAGVGVFSVLIWSLEQEKQSTPQQAARPVQQVYNPYAMAPAHGLYPTQQVPVPQVQNTVDPATQSGQVMHAPPANLIPPGYNPYAMAPPSEPYPAYPAPPAQENTRAEPQSGAQTSQNRQGYPPQGWYQQGYGYGYAYHPSMRFGFNGYMRGNNRNYYNTYTPPPGYGYPQPAGPGYAYPPAPTGEQR